MKFEFVINKYLLIWNLLYQNSFNDDVQKLKQKLWKENKKEYSIVYKEKEKILKEFNDYIPDDDFLFNIVESSDCYKKIKQETNKYKINLLEIWVGNNKKFINELSKILRYDIERNFVVSVVDPNFNMIEIDFDSNVISLGKKVTLKEKNGFLTYLFYKILENEFGKTKKYEKEIYTVILELVCLNELYSRVSGESKYNFGRNDLKELKNKIYPFWLMYLNVPAENMEKHMIKDNLFFNINDYKYENKLRNIDIFSFVNFIINNKEEIMNKKSIGVEKIGVETL